MKRSLFGRVWPNATALVVFVACIFPVYWMFATALKPTGDIIAEDPVWFPTDMTFEHFGTAVDAEHFWTFVRNSLVVTCLAVLFSLIIALAAPSPWPACGSRGGAASSSGSCWPRWRPGRSWSSRST